MRALLILAMLTLAGCTAVDETLDTDDAVPSGPAPVPPGSHPAYGFDVYLPPSGEVAHDRGAPPMKPLPDSITGVASEQVLADVTGGAGIAIFGELAFVGPGSGPMHIVDISSPADASVISTVDVGARDIDTIAYPDRLVTVNTAGGRPVAVVDVTDPQNPFIASAWDLPRSAHNIAVVPGTPIVYNAPSSGTTTDIWDLSDPENPVHVQDWENGAGCHDIMFHNGDKTRAYCAGLDVTQIWDTTDPLHPTVVIEMPFPPEPNGQSAISHVAMPSADGDVLIVGDEIFSSTCQAETALDGTPLEQVAPKRVNIWFYDISNETEPVLHGSISPTVEDNACTNHFGRIIHDREQFIMAFYSAGILVIDFSDLDEPYVVTQHTTAGSAWDVWYYQGWAFTGGGSGGMEVLSFT